MADGRRYCNYKILMDDGRDIIYYYGVIITRGVIIIGQQERYHLINNDLQLVLVIAITFASIMHLLSSLVSYYLWEDCCIL